MTTIKQVLILLLLASLTLACKKKTEDPTIFEGKVVYADDGSPAAGVTLNVNYNLKTTPLTGAKHGGSKEVLIGEKGEFRVEFSYNQEYLDFGILAWSPNQDSLPTFFTEGDGLSCSPHNCFDFKPHQNYSNLLIKVTRP